MLTCRHAPDAGRQPDCALPAAQWVLNAARDAKDDRVDDGRGSLLTAPSS